ncbi:UbiA family prenyltransferase [Acidisoma silvae]|uniref:UbiA family prenyltransferase n=1 Tax=Acidisoma silvae TaxID=2802396 RepID=A0A963YWP6_9PROT|nr:UbiA family prenyltransferase [Acidisoma silvae]MCB8878381.1 UbiA family prenyltransferase [Acidisoma silvae]
MDNFTEDHASLHARAAGAQDLPLVVDLDGTLLLDDSLHEQIIKAFFLNPLGLIACLLHLRAGKLAFKQALAKRFPLDVTRIPLNEAFVTWLRVQLDHGRVLHLCTASHQSIADGIAARLGFFASCIGSDTANLKGPNKAAYLAQTFPDGFAYAGDSAADLAVWQKSQRLVLVGAKPGVAAAAQALGKPIEATFPRQAATFKDWVRAIRVHHWSKNVLVFLPLVLGHDWRDFASVAWVIAGFCVLLMMISSTYLINDLADLESDRAHWSKRNRPIPAGRIAIMPAFLAGCGGILAALCISFLIQPAFGTALLAYLVITLAYSFGLKQLPLLDTFIIALLFTLRLVMGTALANQVYSEWLLAFSMLFFFSLAAAKRQTELLRSIQSGKTAARGYRADDLILNAIFGISTGISSLIILALYFAQDFALNFTTHPVIYHRPGFLWVMPLFVGILMGRVWLLAQRGEMQDDPVSFVLTDRAMLGLGAVAAICFVLAV